MSELLKVERVDVHYGGIQAVRDVSFTLHEGEQATLIGANGAGKSSTVRAITGLENFSGRIEFNGKAVRKHRPETLLRDGLVMVPEGRGIFSRMTVLENLQMGAWFRRDTVTVRREMNGSSSASRARENASISSLACFPAENNSCWPLTAPCSAARGC